MEKFAYTDTETLLWDYSETEEHYVLVIPPVRRVRTLYRVPQTYAYQWFGLNGGNNLKIIYYPFAQTHFRNLTNPCDCPPESVEIFASISVSPTSVLEDSGTPIIYTVTLDIASLYDTTFNFTLTGTAIEGVDYTAITHSVTLTAGQTTGTFAIHPIADTNFEGDETIIATLINGTSGVNVVVISIDSATGTIIESLLPPTAWQQPLSVPMRTSYQADTSSYTEAWIEVAVSTIAPTIGWQQPLSVPVLVRRGLRRADATYNAGWLAATTPSDPFFANVVLLMGFEGANGSTGAPGFTDESPAAHGTATAVGGTIDTSQFKFGSSSLKNGSIAFVDSADWDLGAGKFTIECSSRTTTVAAGTAFIIAQWFNAPNLAWVVSRNGAAINWNVSTTGSDNLTDLTGGTIVINTWFTVCVDYDLSKYRLYVDGTMVASSTTARTIFNSNQPLAIGQNSGGTAFTWAGNNDEIRITKGVARYASDGGYTPAISRFPRQ